MIKPDGVERSLVGEIIARFERKGYKVRGLTTRATRCRASPAADADCRRHCSHPRPPPPPSTPPTSARAPPQLVALKMMVASKAHLETHYADLAGRGFFAGLINYMASGPVVCMVWEGRDAVAGGRRLLGATKPSDSAPGTIRADFAIDVGRNIIHGSDSVENAKKEIALWFKPEELAAWTLPAQGWIYE